MEVYDVLYCISNSRAAVYFGRDKIKSELSKNSDIIWKYFDNNGLFPVYGWSETLLEHLSLKNISSIYDYMDIGYLFKTLTSFSALLINESYSYKEFYAPLFDCSSDIKKIVYEIQCYEDSTFDEDDKNDQVSAFLPSLFSKMATMLVTLHITNPYLAEDKRRKIQFNLLHRLIEHKEMGCKDLLIRNIEDAIEYASDSDMVESTQEDTNLQEIKVEDAIEYASDTVEPTQEDTKPQGVKEIEKHIKSQWKMKDVMIMYYMMKQNKERG